MSQEKVYICQEWPPDLGTMVRACALVNPKHYVLTILVHQDDAPQIRDLWSAEMIPQSSRTNIGVLWDAFVIPSIRGHGIPRVVLEEYDLDGGGHNRVDEKVVLQLDPASPAYARYQVPEGADC